MNQNLILDFVETLLELVKQELVSLLKLMICRVVLHWLWRLSVLRMLFELGHQFCDLLQIVNSRLVLRRRQIQGGQLWQM